MNRHVNAIADRLNLRKPQRDPLEILDRITELMLPGKRLRAHLPGDVVQGELAFDRAKPIARKARTGKVQRKHVMERCMLTGDQATRLLNAMVIDQRLVTSGTRKGRWYFLPVADSPDEQK